MIPGSANPLLLRTAAAGGYQISRSLRFNSADSAYLSRTPASAGNRKTFTWAGWVKRSKSGSKFDHIFLAEDGIFTEGIRFDNTDKIRIYLNGTLAANIITTQVFRDFSAWYHVVFAVDTTQATSTDRIKLYINGALITTFGTATYPSQDYICSGLNTSSLHWIGNNANDFYSDFYLADIHFIDGQALTPSSFTETDATTGQLIPKAYTGSYGTNGFHLEFADNSSNTATTLGKDTSGNSNNWTPNNLSVTAGAGNDSLVDVPTNGAASSGGDAGGVVRGNYCTWNPLINGDTAANGNLDVTNDTARGSHKLLDYDAYWEVTSTGGTTTAGVVSADGTTNTTAVANGKTYGFKLNTTGSLDYINITDVGSFTNITTGLTGTQFPYASAASATTGSLNAGQRPFAAAAPAGFKGICTANLPAPLVTKPSTVMDVVLYTGTGAALTPTSTLGFNPDLVWIKGRSGATDHAWYDSVRGVEKRLESNNTDAEVTSDGGVTAFNSAGFSVGTLAQVNTSSATYAAWTWDAGSSTVTNTAGSITSTVSVRANTTAGFSVVTYTGTGTNCTVGHGLGVAPSLIIVKSRSAANDWAVYHAANTSDPKTDYLLLNSTAATADDNTYWNDTAPTSTVFSIGTNADVNTNTTTYVAYCFAPVAGYSAFGSYTGNGSADGPFVYTGFRPRWIMIKISSTTGGWGLWDTARAPYNVFNYYAPAANSSAAEASTTGYELDILSNGFKCRGFNDQTNPSGATIIYAAFAEHPFQYARAR